MAVAVAGLTISSMSELSVEFELDVAVVFFGLGLRGLVLNFEMIRADRLITR